MTTVFPHIKWPSNWKDLIMLVEMSDHEIKVTIYGTLEKTS